jgi:hypothetical protein
MVADAGQARARSSTGGIDRVKRQHDTTPRADDLNEHVYHLSRILAKIRVNRLPATPMDTPEFADRLPDISCVYFLRRKKGTLLYIGKAVNLRSRFMKVPCGWVPSDSDPDARNMVYRPFHDKENDALALGDVGIHWWALPSHYITIAETILIQDRRPPWNSIRAEDRLTKLKRYPGPGPECFKDFVF